MRTKKQELGKQSREERISLLYQVLMTTRVNIISEDSGHIVIVVSVTIRSHLKVLGLKAANISSLDDHERTRLENGEYSVFYGSPEGACLKNE